MFDWKCKDQNQTKGQIAKNMHYSVQLLICIEFQKWIWRKYSTHAGCRHNVTRVCTILVTELALQYYILSRGNERFYAAQVWHQHTVRTMGNDKIASAEQPNTLPE